MTVDAAGAARIVTRLATEGMVVGDERHASVGGGVYEHHNPATGVVQAEVPVAGADDIGRAVDTARAALPGGVPLCVEQRAAVPLPAGRPPRGERR